MLVADQEINLVPSLTEYIPPSHSFCYLPYFLQGWKNRESDGQAANLIKTSQSQEIQNKLKHVETIRVSVH